MNRKQFVVRVVIAVVATFVCLMAGCGEKKEKETGKDTVTDNAKKNGPEPAAKSQKKITNSIGMEFVYIEPTGDKGFMMGSPSTEKDRNEDEKRHKVILTKGFYLQTTEVTQGQWKEIMGTERWKGKSDVREGPDYPAVYVSWKDAQRFIEKLNEKEGTNKYRLPTDAEWEYACRAGSTDAYYWGKKVDGKYCWYSENAPGVGQAYAHEVKKKRPNTWGLYDMSGNVYEWCQDWYKKDYYQHSPEKDPQGPKQGNRRVLRGGSWDRNSRYCRSADRDWGNPDVTYSYCGFRIVRAPENEQSEEKESEPATTVSKEEPPDEDGVITNTIGMKFKLVKAGEFMMGSEKSGHDEKPVHKVKITRPFYISVYEVTQEQYEKIMGNDESVFKGPNKPADSVTWKEAVLFCKKLSEKEGVEYRLPTEAEWEYACRAGTKTEYYWGDEMDGRYAWYDINSEKKTHDVGQKKPNAWGLYDMSGNVWEWCQDRYGKYPSGAVTDPQGGASDRHRALRGGSWRNFPRLCRSAFRNWLYPDYSGNYFGFRIVRAPE